MIKKLVKNFKRSRKFGVAWSYCDGCSGRDIPTRPEYTGTWRQVREWLANDRTYQAALSGGTYLHEVFFYDGAPIDLENTIDLDMQAEFWNDGEIYVSR